MHELSVARSLLEQVDALRRQQGAQCVVSIQVSVGEFAGVEPDLFRSAYEMLVEDTPMRGAELQMERVPLGARCGHCGLDFAVARFRFECPECKAGDVTIVRGQGLVLESVTIEHSENPLLDESVT